MHGFNVLFEIVNNCPQCLGTPLVRGRSAVQSCAAAPLQINDLRDIRAGGSISITVRGNHRVITIKRCPHRYPCQSGLVPVPLRDRPSTEALRHSDTAQPIQLHAVAPEQRNLIGRLFTRPLCPVLGSKPAPPPPTSEWSTAELVISVHDA